MITASRMHPRICRLISDTLLLLHFEKAEAGNSLTKQQEKDLLVSLSQVLTEIQQAKSNPLHGSNDVNISQQDEKCSETTLPLHDHNCLTKVLADLMRILTVNNQFLQHLVCNILVAVSKFEAASGDERTLFVRLLFVCLELAIANALDSSVQPIIGEDDDSFNALRSGLINANWLTAGGVVQVLRSVLKYLMKDCDDDLLLEEYLAAAGSFLSNMNWDFMDVIHLGGTPDPQHITVALHVGTVCEIEQKVVFLGNFLQFLCSLVEENSGMEVEANIGSQNQNQNLCLIIDIVPKLLHCCLGNQGNRVNLSVSIYFKHKLLMLMLRLTYQTCLGYSTIGLWLQLLHDFFEALLFKPIMEPESIKDECLQGSPFLLSLSDGERHHMDSSHLQRQAVLLFLRCCFGLIRLAPETSKECACAACDSRLSFDSVTDLECCCRKKGFLELYKWLQRHLPTNSFVDHEIYVENCKSFASSFIQLFLHEDDVLFKVLLQLLSVPSCSEKLLDGEEGMFEDARHSVIFHVSSLLNPVYLFHLFLAELHYDHQVLLDYLISKDTGLSCAQYLLRCLRILCNSWDLFVKFSVDGSSINYSTSKKRKIFLDGSDAQVKPSIVSLQHVPPFKEKGKRNIDYGFGCYKIKRWPFKEARDCLLSLKDSLESLHKKHLFPYNPEMLLKRLRNFQDLCINHKSYGLP